MKFFAIIILGASSIVGASFTEQELFFGDLVQTNIAAVANVQVFLNFTPECFDEFDSLELALQNPQAACEIFITNQNPIAIPSDIRRLTHLTSLAIDGPTAIELNYSLWQLYSLTELQLANLNLSSVPEEVTALQNLVLLDFTGNNLQTLPDTIVHLPHLKFLGLKNNQFSSQEKERITTLLPHVSIAF